jgi:hypothetical protein
LSSKSIKTLAKTNTIQNYGLLTEQLSQTLLFQKKISYHGKKKQIKIYNYLVALGFRCIMGHTNAAVIKKRMSA